jgi:hypothetical protein
MTGGDWRIKFISEDGEFGQRRMRYSSSSLFILIYSKRGESYDREELGEALFFNEEFGCIDPPGPIDGFGALLNQEQLENRAARFTLKDLRNLSISKSVTDELFPYLDGIFLANSDEKFFQEKPLSEEYLTSMLISGADDDQIEIVEYEPY